MESAYYSHSQPNEFMIKRHILDLSSFNGMTRQKARLALIHIGQPAVPALIKALHSSDKQTRWEAAKALVEIPSPQAAPALVETLQDEDPGTRWLASEALIALEGDAVVPLLEGLNEDLDCIWVREGAIHVLHVFEKKKLLTPALAQVLAALEGPEPEVRVPWAIEAALKPAVNPSSE